MPVKIQLRRDTTANWASGDAIAAGEPVVEYDANGIAIGVKIGGSSGGTWNSTDYVQGTAPLRSSVGIADLNSASAFGRYLWAVGTDVTTNAPFTIASDDGAVVVDVLVFGDVKVQRFASEGNGTVPSKNYVRVYDGNAAAWRAWQPTTNWASGAAVGTPIECTTITAKGASTLEGVVSVSDGTEAAPAITNIGDTNTGIAFTADDTMKLVANGVGKVTVTDATTTVHNNLAASGTLVVTGATTLGTLAADMNAGTFKLTNVGNPTVAQDAATKAYLESNRIGQTAIVSLNNQSVPQDELIGPAYSTNPTVFTNSSTGISNIRCPANQEWRGVAHFAGGNFPTIKITNTACTDGDGVTLGNPTNPYVMHLIRVV